MQAGLSIDAPLLGAEGAEGRQKIGVKQRFPAAKGDPASCGQIVQVINFYPIVELGGVTRWKGGFPSARSCQV